MEFHTVSLRISTRTWSLVLSLFRHACRFCVDDPETPLVCLEGPYPSIMFFPSLCFSLSLFPFNSYFSDLTFLSSHKTGRTDRASHAFPWCLSLCVLYPIPSCESVEIIRVGLLAQDIGLKSLIITHTNTNTHTEPSWILCLTPLKWVISHSDTFTLDLIFMNFTEQPARHKKKYSQIFIYFWI